MVTFPNYSEMFRSSLDAVWESFKNKLRVSFFAPSTPPSFNQPGQTFNSKRSRDFKRFFKNSFFIPLGIVVAVILLIVVFTLRNTGSTNGLINNDQRVSIKGAKAQQRIDKPFEVSLKDGKGTEVSKLKFVVETAELRDEIVVKGNRAVALEGKTFLVINLKVTNNYNKSVQLKIRDFLRLVKNSNENEKLAPSIHNDPVDVQAISTQYSRVGYSLNDSDKNLILLIGEINGPKQRVTLTLQ